MVKAHLHWWKGKYRSLREISKLTGKNRACISKKLKEGLSIEDAINYKSENLHLWKGKYRSISEIGRLENQCRKAIARQLKRGFSIEEAVNYKFEGKNYDGQKIFNWTLIEEAEPTYKGFNTNHKQRMYKCLCDCGTIKNIRLTALIGGMSKSCGCLTKERLTTHGLGHHPLHGSWHHMNDRCYKNFDKNYKRYGAKGIQVCDRWKKGQPYEQGLINYIEDLEEAYYRALEKYGEGNFELDKDKYGSGLLYSPETCFYLSHSENCQYRKNSYEFTYNNKRYKGFYQFCNDYNVDDSKGQAFRLYLKTADLDQVIQIHQKK